MSRFAYRLSTGWQTENKRTGFGDLYETGSTCFGTLAEAEAAMAQFVSGCNKYSDDRGSYWANHYADIDQIDLDDEVIGQPVRSWQSEPKEVAS